MRKELKLNRRDHERASTTIGDRSGSATSGSAAPAGRALHADERKPFEQQFGHRFEDVRIHDDAAAAEFTRDIGARAATVGQDIFFSEGAHDETRDGTRLLGHELAHVVQNRQDSTPRQTLSDASSGAEVEANRAGDAAAAGLPFSISAAPVAAVARDEDEGEHHHDPGVLDSLFGLNPDRSFVEGAMDPFFGQKGLFHSQEGDGTGTTLARAGGTVASMPIWAPMLFGAMGLDEINHLGHGPALDRGINGHSGQH